MLRAGDILGPYEVRAPLGAGGMGEVYRAHDKRLRRDVAIKVLPSQLLSDDAGRRRFVQEAQSASALNHPNIVSIFDVSLESDPPYLVSELVDGEALNAAISGRPMPVRKLLDLAVQIAEGLAAAHQAGIVHRDLKPANILISRDGRVKIVDFGLAIQVGRGAIAEDAPTAFLTITDPGKVVGTVQYMSPEQARGETLDTRSDIFSFGVVLYEMAAGKRPFQAKSQVEILAAVLQQEPAPLDSRIPLPLRWTIDRCLAKEPDRRYQATSDLASDLRQLRDHLGDVLTGTVSAAMAVPKKRPWLLWVGMGAAALVGACSAILLLPETVSITARQFRPLATTSAFEDAAAWSPDGLSIAYRGQENGVDQIFTRSLDSAGALQVTHCPSNCGAPAWSADGARILLGMNQSIWSIGATGGAMDRLVQDGSDFALSRLGDKLAFVRREVNPANAAVWLSSPPGAAPVRYTPFPVKAAYFNASKLAFSPDGKRLLFYASMAGSGRGSEFWILPMPARSAEPHQVLRSLRGWPLRAFSWMPDSRRVVVAASAQPDSSRTHLYLADVDSGKVRPLVVGIGSEGYPDVSRDGQKLVYSALQVDTDIAEVSLDGSSAHELMASNRLERDPAWSPRSRQLAYVTDRNGPDEIWVTTFEEGWDKPLVTTRSFRDGEAQPIDSPVFSRDGQRLAFERGARIWVVPATGGTPVQLSGLGTMDLAPTWSPDGDWIAFHASDRGLMKVRVGAQEPPVLIYPDTQGDNSCVPEWSPKGDFIAYCTAQGTVLISGDGKSVRALRSPAFQAMGWSADGATLYGLASQASQQSIVALDVETRRERRVAQLEPRYRPGDVRSSTLRLSLSPDSKSLAFTVRRRDSDIWMLENFDPEVSLLDRFRRRR